MATALLSESGHACVMMAVLKLCTSFYKRQKVSPDLFDPESPPRFDPSCRTTNCNTVLIERCNGLPIRVFGRCGTLTLFNETVARALPEPVDDFVTAPLWKLMELYPVEGSSDGTLMQLTEIGSESIGLPRLESVSELLECCPAQEHNQLYALWYREMERLTVDHVLFDVPLRPCLVAVVTERRAQRYAQCYDLAYLTLQAKGVTDLNALYAAANACMFADAHEYIPTFYRLMWHELVIYAKTKLT